MHSNHDCGSTPLPDGRLSSLDASVLRAISSAFLASWSAQETNDAIVLAASRDAIGVSLRGVHIIVNQAYVELFGYERAEQLVGTPILPLIAPSRRAEVAERIVARGTGRPAPTAYETRGLRRDGVEFDMDVHLSTYELHAKTYTLVVLRDITEHKRAQRDLSDSEQRHRELFEHVPVGLWEEDMSAVKRLLDDLGPEATP